MRDGRIKVVPRKNVAFRPVFTGGRDRSRWRCSEELYWETKKISEELQKSNHEQTALIRAYLREAAQLYVEGEPWKTRITDRRLCRNTILNHLQMLANVSFWLREQGEPLAEEVCGWLLAQETADVQKVRSGQSLEVAREIYPAVQRKRA